MRRTTAAALLACAALLGACGGEDTADEAAEPPVTLRGLEVNGDSAYADAATQAEADTLCERAQAKRPANLPDGVVGVTFRNGRENLTLCVLSP